MDLDQEIREALASVSTKNIRGDIAALANLGSRKAGSAGAAKAVKYLQARFQEIGYAAIQTQEFDCTGCEPPHRKGHNVVCGPTTGRRIVLLGGHYDSTSPKGDPAPGADDNASGVAAILELARVLKNRTLGFDVVYAAFGAEEVGRLGSLHCARVARANRWALDLVINLDQIGYRGEGNDGRFVLVQHDRLDPPSQNNAPSLSFATMMVAAARKYTKFQPDLTGLDLSDHRSFERAGFTCIGVAEGIRNSKTHSKNDVLERVSMSYVAEVTRMVLATILTLDTWG
jgi:Zn-dependent M28 family amino/carboxypeptidase